MNKTVRILGTHGVPANYGGFETAAENVARFLVARGWRVIVYCQIDGTGPATEDTWQGIERINIPIARDGWLGTSQFDLLSIRHAVRYRDVCLTFGYNTAIFNIMQRFHGIPNVINMDGIEWSRARWGLLRQAILYTNERIGCVVGNQLIADHPQIATYLRRRAPARKINMITYGSAVLHAIPTTVPAAYGLTPGKYFTLIARPIPENSILEIVQGFSRERRDHELVVLGEYSPSTDDYHRAVLEAASDEVHFLGGVYEPERVQALRFNSLAYLHGHTVGGTNPSLVEALGAGNAVLAHDNPYNRWVAQDAARYFTSADDVAALLDKLITSPGQVAQMQLAARARHAEEFTWEHVAGQYEAVLLDLFRSRGTSSASVSDARTEQP